MQSARAEYKAHSQQKVRRGFGDETTGIDRLGWRRPAIWCACRVFGSHKNQMVYTRSRSTAWPGLRCQPTWSKRRICSIENFMWPFSTDRYRRLYPVLCISHTWSVEARSHPSTRNNAPEWAQSTRPPDCHPGPFPPEWSERLTHLLSESTF